MAASSPEILTCGDCAATFPYPGRGLRAARCGECRVAQERAQERARYDPAKRHAKHARHVVRTSVDERRAVDVLPWDEHIARRAARGAVRQRTNMRLIAEALVGGCVDCGLTEVAVLQFDHVRGTKARTVSPMMETDALRQEIAKCDVRCANCHVRRHLSASRAKLLAYMESRPGDMLTDYRKVLP